MSMRKQLFRSMVILAVVFFALPVYAQKGGGGAEIKIKKIDLKDQVTPQFKDSLRGSQGAKERWFRVDVEFDSKSKKEWIGELEVRWLVAIQIDTGKVAGLTQAITYLMWKMGVDIISARMFLRSSSGAISVQSASRVAKSASMWSFMWMEFGWPVKKSVATVCRTTGIIPWTRCSPSRMPCFRRARRLSLRWTLTTTSSRRRIDLQPVSHSAI